MWQVNNFFSGQSPSPTPMYLAYVQF